MTEEKQNKQPAHEVIMAHLRDNEQKIRTLLADQHGDMTDLPPTSTRVYLLLAVLGEMVIPQDHHAKITLELRTMAEGWNDSKDSEPFLKLADQLAREVEQSEGSQE